MDREQIRQYLEFYRDIGVKSVYLWPDAGPSDPPEELQAAPPAAVQAPVEPLPVMPKKPVTAIPPSSLFPVAPEDDSLEKILADLGECQRCRLCKDRQKIVFGSGNGQSRLVFVGEGPGADEDEQGLPFVGRAGQLLTQMIDGTAGKEGLSIRRPDVYICNVVKCRPPGNRTPETDEMEICGQFLSRQLLAIRPRAICALGGTATKALLGTKEGIMKLRGKWQTWRDIPVMPTYHPSFLLRPTSGKEAKREAWEDLKRVLHYVYDDPPRPLSDF